MASRCLPGVRVWERLAALARRVSSPRHLRTGCPGIGRRARARARLSSRGCARPSAPLERPNTHLELRRYVHVRPPPRPLLREARIGRTAKGPRAHAESGGGRGNAAVIGGSTRVRLAISSGAVTLSGPAANRGVQSESSMVGCGGAGTGARRPAAIAVGLLFVYTPLHPLAISNPLRGPVELQLD